MTLDEPKQEQEQLLDDLHQAFQRGHTIHSYAAEIGKNPWLFYAAVRQAGLVQVTKYRLLDADGNEFTWKDVDLPDLAGQYAQRGTRAKDPNFFRQIARELELGGTVATFAKKAGMKPYTVYAYVLRAGHKIKEWRELLWRRDHAPYQPHDQVLAS